MSVRGRTRLWLALAGLSLLVVGAVTIALVLSKRGRNGATQPGSKNYQEMVSAFYSGLAALDVDAKERAAEKLTLATRIDPDEPASWADRGLLYIRLGDTRHAIEDLGKAQSLAPNNGEIERLFGLLESRRGRFAEAIAHLRRAAELDPNDLRVRYSLAQEIERQGGNGGEEAQQIIEVMLRGHPENLALKVERLRLAAKRGDLATVREGIADLEKVSAAWPPAALTQLKLIKTSIGDANARIVTARVTFLRNSLRASLAYRKDLAAIEAPADRIGQPIDHFLRLPTPSPTPAPPDPTIHFDITPLLAEDVTRWDVAVAVWLTGEGTPVILLANGREVRRIGDRAATFPFPGGTSPKPPTPDGVVPLDWNFDFRTDLVLAGDGGIRLLRQRDDTSFDDATASTGLDGAVLGTPTVGAWAADIEMDGDLDIVVGAKEGPPIVLRNNGDGTFRAIRPFEGIVGLRAFTWSDLDDDGDPDAAALDAAGALHAFANERAGRFQPRLAPEGVGRLVAITTADLNGDGALDLIALRQDGGLIRISDRDEGAGWTVAEAGRGGRAAEAGSRLYAADFDNNGSLDLLIAGAKAGEVLLSDASGKLQATAAPPGLAITTVADLDGDGRLDVAGTAGDGSGKAVRGLGRGAKPYHWQVVRPRAKKTFGDGRINSFGIGGEVEVRAGLLVQKQTITSPVVRFGLGEHRFSDVARFVWPNGTVQAEFDVKADQTLVAEQRLKGSCPFVFADDGHDIKFVTDFLWRSPLGLRINAQDTAGVSQTEDWVKIRGDQLAPRDGQYDVRITADLWETHFFDHVSLLVVDHPEGTEVFVDERFARNPPTMATQTLGLLRPVAFARDDKGRDVAPLIRDRDDRHLDGIDRGIYQGVTRDHWVEIDLGEDAPRDRPLRLVAQGWIHPTDSSLNVALGQGRRDPPKGLSLEVATADGGWSVARPDLGFPAGKNKTIVVDLDGVFRPGAPRRLRLRTNLEIFWDRIAVAEARPEVMLRTTRVAPATAELRHRGFSLMTQADASSPEIPQYETLIGTEPRWRDLIGYHTRFGVVRELLARVDDRYVIMNAGDEMAFRFPAPAPPAPGWIRDFVLIGDGWEKDGDYNTAFSKTVLPLPSHDRPGYDMPPGALEDDPIYRRYPGDWEEFHTRFVTPRRFQAGLKPQPPPRRGD